MSLINDLQLQRDIPLGFNLKEIRYPPDAGAQA